MHLAQTLGLEWDFIRQISNGGDGRTRGLAILLRGCLGVVRPRIVLMARIALLLVLGDARHVVVRLVCRGDRGADPDAPDQLAAVLNRRVVIDVDHLAGPCAGIRTEQRRQDAEVGAVRQHRLEAAAKVDGQLFLQHFADRFLGDVEYREVEALLRKVRSRHPLGGEDLIDIESHVQFPFEKSFAQIRASEPAMIQSGPASMAIRTMNATANQKNITAKKLPVRLMIEFLFVFPIA